ncbi:MAG: hypothetical protein Q9164_001852, partial [Protoblastenia rupestris]
MLDWLTGSAGSASANSASLGPLDEGVSCIEEPPETPAHLFAVRAFKTALFGTPRPEQYVSRSKTEPTSKADHGGANLRVETPRTTALDENETQIALMKPKKSEAELLSSPTKGILLTPGIGTSRRKNVSFMHLGTENYKKAADIPLEETRPRQDDSPTRRSHRRDTRPRPSTFTKTLIELSKQRSDEHLQAKATISGPTDTSLAQTEEIGTLKAIQAEPDHTIDLSHPRSRSGQHWKAEYEQYYRRSDREMKKIIKYGQNVKSYAVKKDSEASRLADRLQKELARKQSVESKVSKLTSRLDVAQTQDTKSEGDHARLVSELAQQTALAVKHKEKADQYREVLQQQQHAYQRFGHTRIESRASPKGDESDWQDEPQEDPLNAQLANLQETARSAVDRASKLEAENAALKRSLARVKDEMMSYESRRQAREERLKKREEKHKIAKETAEAQLAQLRVEHQKLLDERGCPGPSTAQPNNPLKAHIDERESSTSRPPPPTLVRKENSRPGTSTSPRKRRQQNPVIDIWTCDIPDENRKRQDTHPQAEEEPTEIPPSSVKQDINRALQDINLNLLADEQAPNKPKAARIEKKKKNLEDKNTNESNLQAPRPTSSSAAGATDGLPATTHHPLPAQNPNIPRTLLTHNTITSSPPSRFPALAARTTDRSSSLLPSQGAGRNN